MKPDPTGETALTGALAASDQGVSGGAVAVESADHVHAESLASAVGDGALVDILANVAHLRASSHNDF